MSEGVKFDSIVDGKKVVLKLIVENLNVERKCDTEYHIAYTQLMQRGILPKATLEKQMKELDIWRDSDEEQLIALQTKLVEFQIRLEASTTHEEGLGIAKSMGEVRAECLTLVEAKAAVLSNSCEALADSIRRDAYIAYATVFDDTNKKVFRDYEDFVMRATEQCVIDAREQILTIAASTFQESLISLPEINYVRGVEKAIEKEAEEAEIAKPIKKKAVKRVRKKATS